MSIPTRNIVYWIHDFLKSQFKDSEVLTEDTSRIKLSKWLFDKGLCSRIRGAEFFDFNIGITAVTINEKDLRLYLIEHKSKIISIKDVSQMWGLCRIVQPYRSIIISHFGANENLIKLIVDNAQIDVLRYGGKENIDSLIRIYKWDTERNDVDFFASLPLGFHP